MSHVKIEANVLCVYACNEIYIKIRHNKRQILLNVNINYAYNHSANFFVLFIACTSTVERTHKSSVPNPSAEMLLDSSNVFTYSVLTVY
jgi:hypothetical protein